MPCDELDITLCISKMSHGGILFGTGGGCYCIADDREKKLPLPFHCFFIGQTKYDVWTNAFFRMMKTMHCIVGRQNSSNEWQSFSDFLY